jgi:hypothetical protein
MSLVHKITSLFKIMFIYIFFYEKFLMYKDNIHFRTYINENDLPVINTEDCLVTYILDFKNLKFSQVNTKEFYMENLYLKSKLNYLQVEMTFNYNEKVTPHHLSPIMNKIYANSNCNNIKITAYLLYDLIVSILAILSYFFRLYSLPSKILLFDSALKIGSLFYFEFHIDRATEEEFIKNFRRFFNFYVPTYFSNGFLDFIKAAYNLLFSDEFFRVTLNIFCLLLMIFINIFGLVFEEFQEKLVEKTNYEKIEGGKNKSTIKTGHSKKN